MSAAIGKALGRWRSSEPAQPQPEAVEVSADEDAGASDGEDDSAPQLSGGFRVAIRAIFETALDVVDDLDQKRVLADVEEQTIQAVEALRGKEQREHAAEFKRMRTSYAWQQKAVEQKLANMRSASATQGKHDAVKLEQKQKEALGKLERQLSAASIGASILSGELGVSEYAAHHYATKLAMADRVEQQLLQRVTELDGGVMQAEIERQRYVAHVAESALRRMANAALTQGWQTWVEMVDEKLRMHGAARRMLNVHVG